MDKTQKIEEEQIIKCIPSKGRIKAKDLNSDIRTTSQRA